jgi:hypothetical protein
MEVDEDFCCGYILLPVSFEGEPALSASDELRLDISSSGALQVKLLRLRWAWHAAMDAIRSAVQPSSHSMAANGCVHVAPPPKQPPTSPPPAQGGGERGR